MVPKVKKLQSEFISIAKCLVDEERDKNLSLASIQELKQLVPDLFLTEGYADCLVVASNLAVVNKLNLNGDAINTETALAFYKTLLYKGIDIEHQNKKIIGAVVNVGLSKWSADYKADFGSQILEEKDLIGTTDPFNIAYCGIIYRRVSESLIDVLLDCSNPESKNYLSISSSWMLNFNNWDLVYGSENINECEIITDSKQIAVMKPYLRCNGGKGLYMGKPVGRLLKDPDFAGLGIVRSPAGQVKGIVSVDNIYSETYASSEAKEKDLNSKTCDLHGANYTVSFSHTCECGKILHANKDNIEKQNIDCTCGKKYTFDSKAEKNAWINNLSLETPSAPVNTNMTSSATKTPETEKTRTFVCISCKTQAFFEPMTDIANCPKCGTKHVWDSKALCYNADNTVDGTKKTKEKSSQIEKTNVKEYSNMKSIASIQDIENLKQEELAEVSVASLSTIVKDALTKAAAEAKQQLDQEKTNCASALARACKAEEDFAALNKKVAEMQAEHDKMKQEQACQAATAAFNARMEHLDKEYNLDDAYRAIIVKQIKGLDETSFAAWVKDFEVLAQGKKKTQTSTASETKTAEQIAQEALENAEKEKAAALAAGIEGAKKTHDILVEAFEKCVKVARR